jgi:hypothetical protein
LEDFAINLLEKRLTLCADSTDDDGQENDLEQHVCREEKTWVMRLSDSESEKLFAKLSFLYWTIVIAIS